MTSVLLEVIYPLFAIHSLKHLYINMMQECAALEFFWTTLFKDLKQVTEVLMKRKFAWNRGKQIVNV